MHPACEQYQHKRAIHLMQNLCIHAPKCQQRRQMGTCCSLRFKHQQNAWLYPYWAALAPDNSMHIRRLCGGTCSMPSVRSI